MRQIGWLRRGIIRTCTSQRRWSTTLFGVSVFGTLVATLLLIFDGWIDALAVYLICGLILAMLLSQLAGQQAHLHAEGSISNGVHSLDASQPGLLFKQTPRVWLNRFFHEPGPNEAASATVLSKVISRD